MVLLTQLGNVIADAARVTRLSVIHVCLKLSIYFMWVLGSTAK